MADDATHCCSLNYIRSDTKTDGASKASVLRPVPRCRGTDFSYDYLETSDVFNTTAYAPSAYATPGQPLRKDPGKGPVGVMDSWSAMPGRPLDLGQREHFSSMLVEVYHMLDLGTT